MIISTRKGSVHGKKHIQLGYNNQDAVLLETFTIPSFGKTYTIALVADGISGLPSFSRTEVGSNLLVLYAYRMCQELIASGQSLQEVPVVLYRACTEFLRDIANTVMPIGTVWGYPEILEPVLAKRRDKRLEWSSTLRFKNDYLASTIMGFITDGETVATFSKGDGIILVNNDLTIIDQNDRPEYMAATINAPGEGFEIQTYLLSEIHRLAICSDGLQHLMESEDFIEDMFADPENILGLQLLLQATRETHEDLMGDDCSGITLENMEYAYATDDQEENVSENIAHEKEEGQ